MVLRELVWTDIEPLAALEHELFPEDAWAPATWWAELAGRPRREYLVDVEGGAITAYGGVDHGGEVADVMTIAVAPAARGRGRGRAVLAELIVRASARGATSLLLEVRADNAAALALYAGAGFEMLRVRRGYYQPGDVDAHVLRLLLREGETDGR